MYDRLSKKENKQDKAVALKYRSRSDNAPKVVARGKGKVAQKIIDIAKENNIHIHDDPDLVEALAQLDLNDEIPSDLYMVVSELLAFVYSLNRKEKTYAEDISSQDRMSPGTY
jgi:flagellar biosynthesis protein